MGQQELDAVVRKRHGKLMTMQAREETHESADESVIFDERCRDLVWKPNTKTNIPISPWFTRFEWWHDVRSLCAMFCKIGNQKSSTVRRVLQIVRKKRNRVN